jgi:LuxR family maltose regulon positive regulatory protein
VTEDSTGGPSPLRATDDLQEAKLSIPELRPGAVSRTELIETARTSECRVVGVTAPAGYGKTTLLAQWAHQDDRPVAWVSLDRFDDDPGALLTLLAAAFTRIAPGDRDRLVGLGRMSVLGRAAPRLASVMRSSRSPFVLMVDDLHELRSPDCHDVLSVVISGVPAASQLVTASRFEQPHMPRLRALGEGMEVIMRDLALDAAGAEQIFSQARVDLTPEAAVAAAERTEGWPVGLHLAALIARDTPTTGAAVRGDDRYVADYLYSESLSRLTPPQQQFLRRTAVLEHLNAPVCDAVVGQSGSQEQLRTFEALSLFLVPLDPRREWYRYHGLFREFLLGELRRVEPELIPTLHLRAADWYESNGMREMALEHLMLTGEKRRSVALVTELALPTFLAGQIATVLRWLSALGDDAIKAYPPLGVLAGWTTLYAGRTIEAQRWAAFADSASFDLAPLDGSASFESACAMLRSVMCGGGPAQMLADADIAVSQEPPWSPWRDTALCVRAEALLLAGRTDDAMATFREASAVAAASSNTDSQVVSEAELALIAIDHNEWHAAARHAAIASAGVEQRGIHDYPASALVFAAQARLAHQRGDRNETERCLAAALRIRPVLTFLLPYWAVRVRLHLAKVCWALSEPATARHLIREIDDVFAQRADLGTLVDDVDAFRSIMTSNQAGIHGASPLTPAELRLLPYLQTHLTAGSIAERLYVSRNTVNTQISAIYRKLAVTSRSEAVEQATALGLLGG